MHRDLQRSKVSCIRASRLCAAVGALLGEEDIEIWNARSPAASKAMLRFIGLPRVRCGLVVARTNDGHTMLHAQRIFMQSLAVPRYLSGLELLLKSNEVHI